MAPPPRSLPLLIALSAALALPAAAAAHPLGNFTINHYQGLRVGPMLIEVDAVLDMAEIPTFQERRTMDTDGDGTVSAEEEGAYQTGACGRYASALLLTVAGEPISLTPTASALAFPPGQGTGLPTLRLVCELRAPLARPLQDAATITFRDDSYAGRLGWREIVVQGNGTKLATVNVPTFSLSDRLRSYPADLLQAPSDVSALSFVASPGGPPLPPLAVPEPLVAESGATASAAGAPVYPDGAAGQGPETPHLAATVPGGIGEDIRNLIETRDLTPPVLLVSLLVAFGLGALHALSPGHGKTVLAAYLVGSRGTARHAVGLGLVVTVSHTLGVIALGAATLLASSLFATDVTLRWLAVVSGAIVLGIGAWLVRARAFELWRSRRAPVAGEAHGHAHVGDDLFGPRQGGTHGHSHPRPHPPTAGADVQWRSLFALGLSGGLIPSASALLLLVGAIALGRPAYGLVLIIAFSLGMAIVLAGVGYALVRARQVIVRRRPHAALVRLVPFGTALVVLAFGVLLTTQALAQVI